ncbi:adenylate/guanylate cyclase domain-containing protein [Bradyrhizobium sp. MOS002]|nr:adenylate/guanylate cyclase domain-containing protein [Bradyrhizobium sp. MOS002]
MAADVAGYSRLMGLDEEGTLAQLKDHRARLINPKVTEHRGRVVKTTGDGMLAEFASAVEATRCAVDIQLAMASVNLNIAAPKRVELRIGIHVGDIISDEGDIFGDGVNIAARLEGIADPGGICVSARVQEDAEGRLDVVFKDGGEQQLKNIARPVRVYRIQIGRPEAPQASAPMLALPGKPSVAVLSFANMSGDAEQDYFADGMAEDITMALSRFRFLFVISRNSSFTYKGRAVDVKQIGRELGVRYVLEGSVRRSGSKIRVTGQLIDASTGNHLWANNFDGTLDDIFELQDKVTASVVGALIPTMRHAEIERAKHRPTENTDVHMIHMRGIASLYLWTKAGVDEALRLAHEAMKLDPDYSMAYGLAATCYVARKSAGWTSDRVKEMAEVEVLTLRGAEVGRDDAWALGSCGFATASILGNLDTAASLMDRALGLNANMALVWAQSAYVRAWLGEPELALVHVERAKRLSPVDPHMFVMNGAESLAYFVARRHDEAFAAAESALRLNPFFSQGTRVAVVSASLLGRREDAKKYLARLQMLDPELRVSNLAERINFRKPDDFALFAEGLRKGGVPS